MLGVLLGRLFWAKYRKSVDMILFLGVCLGCGFAETGYVKLFVC